MSVTGESRVTPGTGSAWEIELGAILSHVNASTRHDTIVAVEEPTVEPKHIAASIPRVMIESGVWGSPAAIVSYLKHVNGVPAYTAIEVEIVDDGSMRVIFTWWEITARVERPER